MAEVNGNGNGRKVDLAAMVQILTLIGVLGNILWSVYLFAVWKTGTDFEINDLKVMETHNTERLDRLDLAREESNLHLAQLEDNIKSILAIARRLDGDPINSAPDLPVPPHQH
jgi:hypothetical protein